jgi:hypothetical protein
MFIGQTVFENLVVRQIFWLSTQCGSGLYLGRKINFFLLYFCQEKRWVNICLHVIIVQVFSTRTRLISYFCTVASKKMDQRLLTCCCGSGCHLGHKINFFPVYSLSSTYKTAYTDACKTCCITPVYMTIFLQMNPQV